ncbi:hypothetical protein GCM10025331_45670 [Actinoplanes utahensis]|nr:hypothetical protein Aut01nite_30360 [Actinoplanes utahensis]
MDAALQIGEHPPVVIAQHRCPPREVSAQCYPGSGRPKPPVPGNPAVMAKEQHEQETREQPGTVSPARMPRHPASRPRAEADRELVPPDADLQSGWTEPTREP